MLDRPWPSFLALLSLQRGMLGLLLLTAGTSSSDRGGLDSGFDAFVRETTRGWCQEHGKRDDLQAVVVDVRFHAEPPLFAEGEGVVVAPVAVDLPGAQRLIDVASQPGSLRKLSAQGITALAWEYGGRVHREMRFTGVALVERPPFARVTLPENPTFDKLPSDRRPEAMARAADLEEHNLHKCAAFPEWARRSAGAPPHTAQILRLARAVASRSEEPKDVGDDVCAALRAGRFSPHWAQVTVVMAARELGIPALGFASASARRIYLVGTYTDQAGWILVDVESPDEGWFTGGPALVTEAPVLGGFTASLHGFWYPQGAAYADAQWGVTPFSRTEWGGRLAADKRADTTEARALPLSEVCR